MILKLKDGDVKIAVKLNKLPKEWKFAYEDERWGFIDDDLVVKKLMEDAPKYIKKFKSIAKCTCDTSIAIADYVKRRLDNDPIIVRVRYITFQIIETFRRQLIRIISIVKATINIIYFISIMYCE